MNSDHILKDTVETMKSFSKKEQQIKLYVVDRIDVDGGAQGCYNIPERIFDEMMEHGIVKEVYLGFFDRNGNHMTSYTLVEDYTFILSENIRNLINYKANNPGILFIKGEGTKIQINRKRCKDTKKMPQSKLDLEWFVDLYDQNPRPSKIIYILDKNLKIFKMDIEINYNFKNLDKVDKLNEDIDYKKMIKEYIPPYKLNVKSKHKWVQKIYFGPPGTGKSYNVTEEILNYQKDVGIISKDSKEYNSDYVYRTTIYPEYSYYDFIGNIMPIVDKEGKITYDFKPGVFTLALSKALEVSELNIPVYLVIEEISRGNIASIFGDIFQLLDRDGNGVSEYKIDNDIIVHYLIKESIGEYGVKSNDDKSSKKEIYLPSNFNILGTVNTSDQNVFVMDTAFKRRFEFEYVDIAPIKDEETEEYLNEFLFILGGFQYSWNDFYQKLNNYIVSDLELPEDKQIGQFFIKFDKISPEENYKQMQNKLLQYLWEDIHLINITENNLFKEEYKSFSKLYDDFGKHINVFNNKFIESLSKEPVDSEELEDDGEDSLENNEEV